MKPSVFGSFIVIAAMSMGLVAATSDSQRAFLDDEAILAGWESTYGSIRTMRFSYVNRLVDFQPSQTPEDNPDEPPPNPVKYKHVERIEEGKHYHLRYSLAEVGFDNPEWLVEFAFNGKNTQSYMGSTKGGMIAPGQRGGSEETDNGLKKFMFLTNRNTPDVLKDEYPNGIPQIAFSFKIGKLKRKVIVRPNLEYVAGQPCHVVEIIYDYDVRGKTTEIKKVFWMAHDRGMCPMKFQKLRNGELEEEIAIERIAVTDMDGNSVWYPQKAYRTISHDEIGTIRNELTVTDFVPNVEVDEDTFRFDFPLGTHVSDRVLGLSYVVGDTAPDGEVSPVRDISSAEKKQTANEARRQTTNVMKSSLERPVEESEQPTDKNQEKEEDPILIEPVTGRDNTLGLKGLAILGAVVLAAFGLGFWYKRSTNT